MKNMKYRSELILGEGYRDVVPVLSYETFVLGNSDALETIGNTILKGTKLGKEMLVLASYIQGGTEETPYSKIVDDMDMEKGMTFFQIVINEINRTLGKEIKYCLWLADSKEDVRAYCVGDQVLKEEDIDAYEESDVILSDIGSEGKLYGYEVLPEKQD